MTEGGLRVLVLNPGSSSLKASVLDPPDRAPVAEIGVDWGADASRADGRGSTVRDVLRRLEDAGASSSSIDAVGYRVVHGGASLTSATEIDDAVVEKIEALADLAPLHNQIAAETIRAARKLLPGVRHVATFDTAFHANLSPAAYRYPVPDSWYREWGIRRFGFHGLSVEWSVRRASELLGRPADELRLVIAHLGSGCSVSAVDAGRSVATSMGMTPLEGLMMGTRAGSIDPGIILELLRSGRLTADQMADALDHGSGLLGVSGRSADVRELEAAESAGDEASALALELFVGRAAAGIAAVSTSLAALDAIVFTGGIGEHSASIRMRILETLAVLKIGPIEGSADRDRALTPRGATPAVLRVAAREDVVIADAVGALLGAR